MNFPTTDVTFNRQRCRQWIPLITQQFRLRHLHEVLGFNLQSDTPGSFYFTLHSTTMCAPFYTSDRVLHPHPKWSELNLNGIPNTSATCVVLRMWRCGERDGDNVVLTWGVHFSGLVYLGSKIADIQPVYFNRNSVIFGMQGGYYTSLDVIKLDFHKRIPFLGNLNVIDTSNGKKAMYRRIAMKCQKNEVQDSYRVDKLKAIQVLQVEIKNKLSEVQNIQEKINVFNGSTDREQETSPSDSTMLSPTVRYAPQLLTMTSLNKMLQEKPTRLQKQEMLRLNKEIELAKFKARLLHQEKDKKTITIRQLKQKLATLQEDNEERNSDLMENYHNLSRGSEKLKDYKKDILNHREVCLQLNQQLHHRRKQLLQELLFIFPIEKVKDDKYTIYNIFLPNSDILADSSDVGVSVALGYVTHILIMCSTFLQVPLRYPLTHLGSRSYITDNISPLLLDKERDFPLYTRSKDKAQFIYAVFLLNKNIAQLRWLVLMNTNDLKATLSNLLNFLQGQKDPRPDPQTKRQDPSPSNLKRTVVYNLAPDKYVGLHSFGSTSNISDPILDCIRQENQAMRSSSPTRSCKRSSSNSNNSRTCRDSECGRGLSEILAIPEAYLNKQISSDSLRNYMASGKSVLELVGDGNCCGMPPMSTNDSFDNLLKLSNGKEAGKASNPDQSAQNVEQATDALNLNIDPVEKSKPIEIPQEDNLGHQARRLSSSEGSSYTVMRKAGFEIGSEPFLHHFVKDFDGDTQETSNKGSCDLSAPLTARTKALLTTKSFNLVKPKP